MRTKIIFTFLILINILITNSYAGQLFSNASFENSTLEGENIFKDTINIKGRLTIQEGGSLTILPGTKLVFQFIDEDHDGIGESEILSQGQIKAIGTKEKPILFVSNIKKEGAWMGFSIMNVDIENVIENAIFEDAYMALHAHFSNLTVNNSKFRNNFRGFQSQEGTIHLNNNEFYHNNTGIQFRNSTSFLDGNKIFENIGGLNFLYSTVTMHNNIIKSNKIFGIKLRFSKVDIANLTVQNSMQNIYGKNTEITLDNVISEKALTRGFSFENSRIIIRNSIARNNLLDGISLDSSMLECDKLALSQNGRFHIYLKGKSSFKGGYLSDRDKDFIFIEQ